MLVYLRKPAYRIIFLTSNSGDFMYQRVEPIRTAEEMYDYCKRFDMGTGSFKSWSLKHFGVIEKELRSGEDILTAFIGLINGFNCAFVITTERLIFSKKAVVGSTLKSVTLKNINDTTIRKDLLHGYIQIDTTKEQINIVVPKKCADNIYYCIHASLDWVGQFGASKSKENTTVYSAADEIAKFKSLLDNGAITHDEFEAKKRQLLGL